MQMDFLVEPSQMVFFAGRAVILVAAFIAFAVVFARWRNASARDMQRVIHELEQSRGETRTLAAATEALLFRIGGIESKLDTRVQAAQPAAAAAPRGYELALRLARAGSSVEDITETSGVTRREAELLARLHGPRRTA
jgi:hypothetical protein